MTWFPEDFQSARGMAAEDAHWRALAQRLAEALVLVCDATQQPDATDTRLTTAEFERIARALIEAREIAK